MLYLSFSVMISRQQRRVQLMRIRQKEERRESSRKKKRKQPQNAHHTHAAKALHPEPAYRRKPNPIRRFDGDVLSPVSPHTHTILHTYLLALTYSHIFQSRVEINGKVTKTLSKLNMWLQCPWNEFLDLFVCVTFCISLIAFLIIWMENWFNPLMHMITP